MLRPVLILATCFLIAQAEILLGPSDAEAAIGTDVTLRCSLVTHQTSECFVEWTHKKRNGDLMLIYTSCLMIGEFGTWHSVVGNFSNGQFNLKITNVSLEDSGTYTCRDNKDGSYRRAQLIVFEFYPSAEFCSVFAPLDGPIGYNTCGIEPDEVKLSCNMSFSGNAIPIMEWIQADGVILASNITSFTTITDNSVTVSSLILNAAHVQSAAYTCRIKYLQPNLTSKISWSATPRIFHMMNRNETLLMKTSSQEFDCAKGGFPGNCSFSWEHDGARLPDSSSVLTLTEERVGIYTCSAVCGIRGRNCTITQDLEMINDKRISMMIKKTVIISASIVAVVLFSAGVGIFFLIRSHCRSRKDAPRSTEMKSLHAVDEEGRPECRDEIMKYNERRLNALFP